MNENEKQTHAMSSARVRWHLSQADVDLADAHCESISPSRRYAATYDAAIHLGLAFAGANHQLVRFDADGVQEVLLQTVSALGLDESAHESARNLVRKRRAEEQNFGAGITTIRDDDVEAAMAWTNDLRTAVNSRRFTCSPKASAPRRGPKRGSGLSFTPTHWASGPSDDSFPRL